MGILHRYILKDLFYYFFVLVLIFCVIIGAKETYNTRDEILDDNPALVDVVTYVALTLPSQFVNAIPLLALFSVLFALGMLAKNREILAMVAAGVSFNYLAVPVIIFGVLLTIGSFLFAEYVAPSALRRSKFIYEVRIRGETQYAFNTNAQLFRKGKGNRFYYMASFDEARKIMTRPQIMTKNASGNGLVEVIEAEEARYVGSPDGKSHFWECIGYEKWTFDEDGAIVSHTTVDIPYQIELDEKIDSFLSAEKHPEEMSLAEVRDYLDTLTAQGTQSRIPEYRTAEHAKMSLPFSCLLLSLMGFSIAVDLHIRRFVLAFSLGLSFGIIYYVVRETMVGMGSRAYADPIIAAWAPAVVLATLILGLFHRLSRVN